MHVEIFKINLYNEIKEIIGGIVMGISKLLYSIGLVSLVSLVLYFVFYAHIYTQSELIEAYAFFGAAVAIYFIFVFLYNRGNVGKWLSLAGLVLIAVFAGVLFIQQV